MNIYIITGLNAVVKYYFKKNGGGGGNRTRVRDNGHFKSFTGLFDLLSQINKARQLILRLPSCCAPPQKRDSILIFYFRWNLPVIRYWVTRSAKTQQTTLLERELESDYCYWQLSNFQQV